jgi:hypothetical protein
MIEQSYMMREIDKLLLNELRKRCFQLESELAEASEKLHRQNNEYIEVCFNISSEREVLKTELAEAVGKQRQSEESADHYKAKAEEFAKELAEFKRQIAAGELFTPQTIHSFLETKHDRWNPLYMDDLVKFAAEKAKEGEK